MSEVKKDLIFKHFRENPKEYWDKRSSSFFKMLQNDVENESKVILEVLKEKNLKENLKVLDLTKQREILISVFFYVSSIRHRGKCELLTTKVESFIR